MRTPLAITIVAILALGLTAAAAQEAGTTSTDAATVRIGDQFGVILDVPIEEGETVVVDRAAESWADIEVVDVAAVGAEGGVARFRVTVAAFATGPLSFEPAVLVNRDGIVDQRMLPPVALTVASTLAADAPAEVSAVAPPLPAGGGVSPLVVPGIVSGVLLASAGLAVAVYLLAGKLKRRVLGLKSGPKPPPPASLDDAERLLDSDYVTAYRMLSSTFRTSLGHRFELPAPAFTSSEIEGRMTAAGVDPWTARLSREVLAACDAVVYGGYRPAAERQRADFAMARQVVGPTPGVAD